MALNRLKKRLGLIKILKKSYNHDIDSGSFIKADVQYFQELPQLHNDLPFLPERMKIEKIA